MVLFYGGSFYKRLMQLYYDKEIYSNIERLAPVFDLLASISWEKFNDEIDISEFLKEEFEYGEFRLNYNLGAIYDKINSIYRDENRKEPFESRYFENFKHLSLSDCRLKFKNEIKFKIFTFIFSEIIAYGFEDYETGHEVNKLLSHEQILDYFVENGYLSNFMNTDILTDELEKFYEYYIIVDQDGVFTIKIPLYNIEPNFDGKRITRQTFEDIEFLHDEEKEKLIIEKFIEEQ